MASRRSLAGVLNAVLARFVSRNADYAGYWLIGQLVKEGKDWNFDLTPNSSSESSSDAGSPCRQYANNWAADLLVDQLCKHDLPLSSVSQATLKLEELTSKSTQSKKQLQVELSRNRAQEVKKVMVTLSLISDRGRSYQNTTTVLVAPHNPNLEQASYRPGSPLV